MSDGLVMSLLKKVTGLFIDVNKLKDDTKRTDSQVRKLTSKIDVIAKVQDMQGREAEALKSRVSDLESQNHGLKVSRGRIKAKLERTENRN